MTNADWKRLGELVVAARVAKGMTTRDQLAQAGGFSARLLGDIENGRRTNYDQVTLAQIEQALDWAAGSVRTVLDGGDPRPAREPATTRDDLDDDIDFEIRMIQTSDLPERQKTELIRYARDLQRRQRAEREALRDRQAADRHNQIRSIMDIARNDPRPANG